LKNNQHIAILGGGQAGFLCLKELLSWAVPILMAVPYIGGYNPDYSGLDFSEAASALIIKSIVKVEDDVLIA
jgi:hypothetical protein